MNCECDVSESLSVTMEVVMCAVNSKQMCVTDTDCQCQCHFNHYQYHSCHCHDCVEPETKNHRNNKAILILKFIK